MKIRLDNRVSLELNLELKPGYSAEEFFYYLSYTMAHFVKPKDVANFNKQYLPIHLQSEKPSGHNDKDELLN